MKPLLKIVFQVSLIVVFLTLNKQLVYSQKNHAQLFVSISDMGPATSSFVKNNNVRGISVIYQRDIDPRNELKLDPAVFTAAVNRVIPNANATGYACIDWEGKIAVTLQVAHQNTAEFQNAIAEFIRTIELARQLRPNMKWGFFGIPYQPLDKRDRRSVNADIPQLLKLCDVFYPAMYVPYNSAQSIGYRTKAEKEDWVSYNLSSTLGIANKMNKPVLAFLWHRYYSAGFNQNSLKLIPPNEFKNYVKEILALNYSGKMVDGLIFWGEDTYYYKIKSKPVVDEFAKSRFKDFPSYHDSLTSAYLKGIKGTLDSSKN